MRTLQESLDNVYEGDHGVVYYNDTDYLAKVVGTFLSSALKAGEKAILVAKPENLGLFERSIERLTSRPASQWKRERALVVLDAEVTLSRFMTDDYPDWKLFEREIRPLVEECTKKRRARAYGEMVDILWQKGARDAALRLEGYWNRLLGEMRFSLLCAYALNPLALDVYDENFVGVCHCHNSIIPPQDAEHFHRTVDHRLGRVLGSSLSAMVSSMAMQDDRRDSVPDAQKYLLWLAKNMPATARRILETEGNGNGNGNSNGHAQGNGDGNGHTNGNGHQQLTMPGNGHINPVAN